MATQQQSFTRPAGTSGGGDSTQYTGIYLKVMYPGSNSGFDVVFNSPIINSLGMTSSPQWGVEPAAGRADPLYRLEAFTRQLRCSFTLPAHSAAEQDDNYFQLNRLSAATLPYYDKGGNNGFNGCHVAFYIGGAYSLTDRLFQGMGILDNVDFSWDERTPWNTADTDAYTAKILPQGTTAPILTTVSFNINVVSMAKQDKRYHLKEDANPTEMFFLQKYSK